MNKTVKKYMYSTAWVLLLTQSYATTLAGGLSNQIRTTSNDTRIQNDPTWGNLVGTIENFLAYIVWLLYLIAVVYGLYGGFQILTAWGDDGKVKAWKTTLINAALWLAAIFLSSVIINWVIWLFAVWTQNSVIN